MAKSKGSSVQQLSFEFEETGAEQTAKAIDNVAESLDDLSTSADTADTAISQTEGQITNLAKALRLPVSNLSAIGTAINNVANDSKKLDSLSSYVSKATARLKDMGISTEEGTKYSSEQVGKIKEVVAALGNEKATEDKAIQTWKESQQTHKSTITVYDSLMKKIESLNNFLPDQSNSVARIKTAFENYKSTMQGTIPVSEEQITELDKEIQKTETLTNTLIKLGEQRKQQANESKKNKTTGLQIGGTGAGTQTTQQAPMKPYNLDTIGTSFKPMESITEYFSNPLKVIPTFNNSLQSVANNMKQVKTEVSTSQTTFDKLKEQLQSTSSNTNTLSDAWSKFSKSLTGTLVRFRIVSGFIKGIANSMLSLIETAASYEESLNLYTMALGNFADEGKEWAETITDALYLDPTSVLQYTGALYNLVEGLGVSSDYAYKMSTNLTQLVYDMSSYLNIDVESSYEKLRSAMSGQSRAVASVGVALTQASLQELAYSLGIDKSVTSMTQAEKTYLRYIQIMNQTKKMQGDLGKTLVTPENALRLLKTQFTLLAKSIGNIFIPILLKALPYVMALTNVLNQLAQALAKWAGYTGAQEIDYSSTLENISSAYDGISESSDNATSSINRTLAAFDDLNVVESKSTGTGGTGTGTDSVIDKLKDYIEGYDMLKDLTADLETQASAAEGTIKKLLTVVAAFTGGLAIGKLVKFINGLSDTKTVGGALFSVFKKGLGWLKTAGQLAIEGFSTNGIKGLSEAIKVCIGNFGTVIGTIGSVVSAFATSYSSFEKIGQGVSTLNDEIGKLTIGLGLAAVAAGLLAGPWGVAAVAVAGLLGGTIGYSNALQDLEEKEAEQERYNTLFDGQGVSLSRLNTELNNMFEPLETYNTKTDELNTKTTDANTAVENARLAIENLQTTLEGNSFEENVSYIGEIKTAYDTLKESVIEADKAEQNRELAMLSNLLAEGQISQETYDQEKKDLEELTNLRAAQAKGYYTELADLQAQLSTGKITQDEYNEEIKKLASDYSLVAETGNDLTLHMQTLYEVAKDGFDLENPEKMQDEIDTLREKYQGLMTDTTTTYNNSHELNEKQLADYDYQIKQMELLGHTTGKWSKEYELLRTNRNNLAETDKQLTEQYNTDMENIGGTFKGVMATFLAQIDEAGKTTDSDMADVVSSIETSLDELKDYDLSTAGDNIFSSFTSGMDKSFSGTAINKFKKYGVDTSDNIIASAKEELDKQKPQLTSIGENLGKGVSDGINNESSKTYLQSAADKYVKNTHDSFAESADMHSPAKAFNEDGMLIAEGVADGFSLAKNYSLQKVDEFVSSLQGEFSKQKFGIAIDTSVESSFNSILNKLQTFCNNWRSAVNSLVKNMKTTMNGITLDDNGKISYTTMPKVTVSKFAEGGFPSSGDLFLANENGPEFITSIGNKSAVANQDQMVRALTNAIVEGFSTMSNGTQKGDTIVYIGSKKVYEGQGTYQNRQADRYGTSSIIKV